MRERARVCCWLLACAAAACAVRPYSPCPVGFVGALPADAFATCRQVLADRYGAVVVADEAAFLLQTGWVPSDRSTERRAAACAPLRPVSMRLVARVSPNTANGWQRH